MQPAPIGWPEFTEAWDHTGTHTLRTQQANKAIHNSYYSPSLLKFFRDENDRLIASDIVAFLLPRTTGGYYDGIDIQTAYEVLYDGGERVVSEDGLRALVAWLVLRPEFHLQ